MALVDDEVVVNVTSTAEVCPSVILLGFVIVIACFATASPLRVVVGPVAKETCGELTSPFSSVPDLWGTKHAAALPPAAGKAPPPSSSWGVMEAQPPSAEVVTEAPPPSAEGLLASDPCRAPKTQLLASSWSMGKPTVAGIDPPAEVPA